MEKYLNAKFNARTFLKYRKLLKIMKTFVRRKVTYTMRYCKVYIHKKKTIPLFRYSIYFAIVSYRVVLLKWGSGLL